MFSIDGEPGFNKQSLHVLKRKVQETDVPVLVSMCLDEMSLHEGVQFDGNQFVGGTDLGGHEIGDGTATTAKEALVFMVVALNSSWRLPLGYFFVAGLNAKGKKT